MSHIAWDPTLETGNPIVDGQHKDLFAMVNDLRDACVDDCGRDAIEGILHRLAAYVDRHFSEEEALMRATGYPEHEAAPHLAAHAALRAKTGALLEQYRSGEMVTVLPVAEFLFEWLRTHIRNVDAKLVAHVKTAPATS